MFCCCYEFNSVASAETINTKTKVETTPLAFGKCLYPIYSWTLKTASETVLITKKFPQMLIFFSPSELKQSIVYKLKISSNVLPGFPSSSLSVLYLFLCESYLFAFCLIRQLGQRAVF